MNLTKLQSFVEHVNFSGGVLIPHRWELTIPKPPKRNRFMEYNVNEIGEEHLTMACRTVQLPGRTISTNAVVAPGPEQKYPYQDVFDDLEVTFICTTGNTLKEQGTLWKDGISGIPERRYFDAWQSTICDQETMVMEYSENYSVEMILTVFDNKDVQLGNYIFDRCYPLMVGPIEFSHDTDAAAEFSVTFNYDRWEYNEKRK